jgi:hypothetical protein
MDWPGSKAAAGRHSSLASMAPHSFGTAIGRQSLDERLTPCSLHAQKPFDEVATATLSPNVRVASRPGFRGEGLIQGGR